MTAAEMEFAGSSVKAIEVDIFRRGATYRSHDREKTMLGDLSIDIGIAPPLMLNDDSRWLRRQIPQLPPLPPLETRRSAIHSALTLFRSGNVSTPMASTQSRDDFLHILQSGSGLPTVLTARWIDLLCSRVDQIELGGEVGGIELVSLPANTFVCLEACFVALLRSEAVWIRPSRREPFSTARFLGCLIEVGWPAVRLGMYPTRHEGFLACVDVADRAVVFGGHELPKALDWRSHVKVHGPGRTCALIGRDADLDRVSRWLTESIASQSGRFCTNVGTVLCCAGDTDSLGLAIAAALDQISLDSTVNESFPQAMPINRADALRTVDWVMSRMRPDDVLLTSRPILVEVSGRSALAPSLIRLGRAEDHPLIGMELPFPVACIGEVPEVHQPAFCKNANFIYVVGNAPEPDPSCFPPHANLRVIDLNRNPSWP
jgi:hypothetical protein